MKHSWIFFLSLTFISFATSEEYRCKGERNNMPVLEVTPQLTGEVANGKKWLIKDGDNILYVSKVSGTPYEMGYALGQLYAHELEDQIKTTMPVMSTKLVAWVYKYFELPEWSLAILLAHP